MNSQNFNSAEIGTGWDRLKCKNWQDYLLLWLPAVRKIPPSLQSTQYRISITNRRKFRSQTSDNMDRWKAEMGRVREKRRVEERRWQKRKSQKKEAQMREKVGKSRDTVFFQWFVAPEGRKVGSLKRRGAEPSGQMRDKKVHAVVARSTFRSQSVQNTPFSGSLLEVAMSKKCTPLCLEAHFEVKMLKTPGVRTTFGGSNVVPGARDCAPCQEWAKREGFVSFSITTTTTPHNAAIHYNYNYTFTTFHYTTLHYTALHSIELNYTQLHSITRHYTTLDSTTLHYTTLHYATLHYTTLHYTTLHYIPLHSTTLHYTNYNNPPFYYATLRYTNYTTLHKTSFHYTALHLQLQLQLQLHYISLH